MAKVRPSSSSSPVSRRRAEWIVLALILVVGAGLRIAYLVEIAETPDFRAPGRDALYHDYWARALATGDWTPPSHKADPEIRTTPYMRPPVYPYFLAGVYAASGGSHLAARIAQMIVGLLNVVLAFWLGRAVFSSRVGLVFAALMATYWIFIYYEGELHAPVLEVFCTLALLNVLSVRRGRPSLVRVAVAGVVIGLFALIRPNALLLAPAVLGWLLWLGWRRGDLRRALVPAAVLTASVAAAVAPATLRNYLVSEDIVLVTTNAGINLYLSHNEHAAAGSLAIPELRELAGLSGWTCFEYPAMVRGIARKLGEDPDTFRHSEASAYFSRRAWSYIRQNPGAAVRSAIERALLFWGTQEVSTDEVVHYDRRYSAVLSRIPGGFSLVLTLALAGAAAVAWDLRRGEPADDAPSRARFETFVLPGVFIAAYFLSVWPAPAAARYRVPILPCLMLFAAYGLVVWAGWWKEGAARRAVVSALMCAAVYGVVSRPWTDYVPDEAVWHFNRAVAYSKVDDLEAAAGAYRRALEIDAGRPETHSNLGSVLIRLGETESAVAHFRAALDVEASHAEAHHNLATALLALERRDEAFEHLRRAVEIRPGYASARRKLALLLADRGRRLAEGGDVPAAIEQLTQSTELEPENPAAQHQLGMLLAQTGDLEGAAARFESAIRLDPEAAALEMNLGNVLAMLGRFDEAIVHFRRAVELEPRSAGAHRNLAMAYARLERFDEAARAAGTGAEALRQGGNPAQARELDQLYEALKARM